MTGHILISHLVVADLFMHLLPGLILLYLAVPFYTEGLDLHEILYMYVAIHGSMY